jgi:hypothetical protein
MPTETFERLLGEYLDGLLDDAGRTALALEVERDGGAARTFDEALALEALLIAAHRAVPPASRVVARRPRPAVRVLRRPVVLAAAAALCLAVVGAGVWFWAAKAAAPNRVLRGTVLVGGAAVERIADGARIEVAPTSEALIRLADGSRAAFDPASVAVLRGRGREGAQTVELEAGKGAFEVDRPSEGFRVVTAVGDVAVMGTVFSVALRGVGEGTEETASHRAMVVEVRRGRVAVSFAGKTHILESGEKETFGGEPPRPPEPRRPAEPQREEKGLPDGLQGFRGRLFGTVVRVGDRGFVLKVEKVLNVWESNRASRPESAVGRSLPLVLQPEGRLSARHLETFRGLRVGDRVVVEAFHEEGDRLTVVEEFRKEEGTGAQRDAPNR